MMLSSLKNINIKQANQIINDYKGFVINHPTKLPEGYVLVQKDSTRFIQREYLYQNFKEAFINMSYFAQTCHAFGYYP